VTSEGDLHDSLQLGEFIIDRLPLLDETDLRNCLLGFNQSESFKTVEVLEQHLLSNLHSISAATVSNILYDYAKERIGSRTFLKTLLAKVELESENASLLENSVVVEMLVALNLTGNTKSRAFKNLSAQASKQKSELSQDEIKLLSATGIEL